MIKQHGGVAVVQDPEEALYQGMPLSAIQKVAVDYVLPVTEIATLLVRLAHERSESLMEQPFETSPEEEAVPDSAEGVTLALEEDTLSGPPSALTCPDCGGRCGSARMATWSGIDATWATPSRPKVCS